MRGNENVMQEIIFSSVGQNHKTLTANLTRPQIKIPLPEDLKDLQITEIQTKQGFHLAIYPLDTIIQITLIQLKKIQ